MICLRCKIQTLPNLSIFQNITIHYALRRKEDVGGSSTRIQSILALLCHLFFTKNCIFLKPIFLRSSLDWATFQIVPRPTTVQKSLPQLRSGGIFFKMWIFRLRDTPETLDWPRPNSAKYLVSCPKKSS